MLQPTHKSDALVIGAGPAGASTAILLAQAGWDVSLVEQQVYPRPKVCGECIAAGNLALLDELGVGSDVRRLAGPELKQVGWMRAAITVSADMPACPIGAVRYGRALGRDVFDELLLARARAAGVVVLQPARVRRVRGSAGAFECEVADHTRAHKLKAPASLARICTSIVIDAHGSWESGPVFDAAGKKAVRPPQLSSDLFAFKASFYGSTLTPGWLPVVALRGGYGGLVVANEGHTTVALCLRRDALRALRAKSPGVPAGIAVEAYLRASCHGVRDALIDAQRKGSWLTVGPLRPGTRLNEMPGVFRVGNAAGESHPLIGEGISMALQSSKLLVESLLRYPDHADDARALSCAHRAYARAWRGSFKWRLRLAALYAHIAMRAPLGAVVGEMFRHWPNLLTTAARLAGKARHAANLPICEEPI